MLYALPLPLFFPQFSVAPSGESLPPRKKPGSAEPAARTADGSQIAMT